MFESLLGRAKKDISVDDKEHIVLLNKIDRMNLTEMRSYIKNSVSGLESSSDGLSIVLRKIIDENKTTNKRYIEIGDMDSKIKKAFELVLAIATHKRVTIVVIEQIQEFVAVYEKLILKFDMENKEIYASRFKKAIKQALITIHSMAEINTKMRVLK
ncbi:MAG: hypothetical protein U9P38_00755 [Campylobacterota bacterium]|nr:hypothetical protein [Campylobacterota bacterium]